jgi:hypothetical protein
MTFPLSQYLIALGFGLCAILVTIALKFDGSDAQETFLYLGELD